MAFLFDAHASPYREGARTLVLAASQGLFGFHRFVSSHFGARVCRRSLAALQFILSLTSLDDADEMLPIFLRCPLGGIAGTT